MNNENIYNKDILPLINKSSKGDKIFFISPSTFFGFYSLGAKNYIEVCDALYKAKNRKVDLKLIINIHDSFSAKAAQGLLSILEENNEIRHIQNTSEYFIILITKNEVIIHEFISELPSSSNELLGFHKLNYLNDVTYLPFSHKKNAPSLVSDELEIKTVQERFNNIWKNGNPIKQKINEYDDNFSKNKTMFFEKSISYLSLFFLGLIIGWLKNNNADIDTSKFQIFLYDISFSMIIALITTALAGFFTFKKWKK